MQGYTKILTDYWDKVPDSVKQAIPSPLATKISIVLLTCGAIGSIIEKGKKDANDSSAT